MWLRLNKDRKLKAGLPLRTRNTLTGEKSENLHTLTAAKSAAESLAKIAGVDIEVVCSDAGGDFVTAVATPPKAGGFVPAETTSEELREAYAQSVNLATSVKTQLLETLDLNAVHGVAMMLTSFKAFAQQYQSLIKEPTEAGIPYSVLTRVYCKTPAYEKVSLGKMFPAEMANLTTQWRRLAQEAWKVEGGVSGLGDAKGCRIDPKTIADPQPLAVDNETHLLHINPFTVGTLPNGAKFGVVVEAYAAQRWQAIPANMAVLAAPEHLEEAVAAVKAEMRKHDIYKGRILIFSGGNITGVRSRLSTTTWGSVVPVPKLKEALDHIAACIFQAGALAKKGLGIKEGLLISGPPGIGKSVSLRAFLNQVAGKATVCYVERTGDLRGVYTFAEQRSPAVVVLEDVDAIAQDRNTEYRGVNAGVHPDLLTVLSGVAEVSNVVTIATTNHPEQLDAAIAKRPGRFDNHVRVTGLSKEIKLEILRHYLERFRVPKTVWKSVEDIFEPLSKVASVGAHIERFVEGSVKRAAVEGRDPTVFDFRPQAEALMSVADK